MNAANFILALLAPQARMFEKITKDPIKAQGAILFEYLSRNKNTEYGRKYGFSSIRSIEDYKRKVPLSDCEIMRPYLDRMTKGEPNILTMDRPIFFGATSGTTSARKYIPTTRYSQSKKAKTAALWAYYILRGHPDILKGRILVVISPETEEYTKCGIPSGAESGHGYRHMPAFIKHFYVLPYCVFEIPDYQARYYAILRISMAHNVTTVTTLNPNTLNLLCQKIEQWQDAIINDIENGTLSGDFNIPERIRTQLLKKLKPDLKRASQLKNILKEKRALLPKYFWPNLELIECWKGGSMKLFLKELEAAFGSIPIRDMGTLSTEARSSIPLTDEGSGGVLTIQTNFYEFIPMEDIGKKDRPTLLCSQLEKGKEYFIIVTTPGGLYRYNMDDIIRVDGFFNNTPVIEFIQKGSNAISLAGEKLYEAQLNEAVNIALTKSGIFVELFSAVAKFTRPPHYAFVVEFAGNEPSSDAKKYFLRSVDEELRLQNQEYDYFRKAELLAPPVMKVAVKGSFEKYKIKRLHQGAHDGQFKVSELTSDQNFESNFQIKEEITLT